MSSEARMVGVERWWSWEKSVAVGYASPMACHCASSSSSASAYAFVASQQRYKFINNTTITTTFVSSNSKRPHFVLFCAINDNAASSTTVVSEASIKIKKNK